jgi:NAD(P)-dependent dehydrogenase (short-subunit alcohol dehydrogenase family)
MCRVNALCRVHQVDTSHVDTFCTKYCVEDIIADANLFQQVPGSAIILTMSIQNKVTIITGAGRGIGRATALRFARQGARVVLFSRTAAPLAQLATEIEGEGHSVLSIAGDVSNEEDVIGLFQKVMETYGRVDALVNCAGVVAVKPFVDMDAATWDSVIGVNLRGTFLCCREAFRVMAAQHSGVILNLSSLSGVKGVEKFPGLSAYNVSKAGVASLTEILAVEGKPHNIRVCAVSPGAVDTEMLRQAAPHLHAGMTPDDMSEILLFLAGDSGRMLNGTNLEIFSNA